MEDLLRYFPSLNPLQQERFAALKGLYCDWNAKINVISRKDMDDFYTHHVLHSLAIAAVYPGALAPSDQVLDLGTGGGFPGIPLSIFYPQCQFTLCDSIGKKVMVAREVAKALSLTNVTCLNCRAESLTQEFDWVVSRAVASLDKFLPWVKGRYAKGVICLKGGDLEQEIASCSGPHLPDHKKVSVSDIGSVFKEEWFSTKKVVLIKQ